MKTYEYCCECDELTGNAGEFEDSNYTDDGNGPYCDGCFEFVLIKKEIAQLQKENEQLKCCGNCDNYFRESKYILEHCKLNVLKPERHKTCKKWIINSSLAQGE